MAEGQSTTDDVVIDAHRMRVGRAWRRVLATVLWVFVAAAAFGALGVRTTGVSGSSGALQAQLRFPRISRPGDPANWSLDLQRKGGFTGTVTVATNDSYFAIFDQNDLSPDPVDSTIESNKVVWTFDKPDGEDFSVQLDGNIDSNAHLGRHDGTTTVTVGDETVTLHYTTWTAP
jgi:hypothetical protein